MSTAPHCALDELAFDPMWSTRPSSCGTAHAPHPLPDPYLLALAPDTAALLKLDPAALQTPEALAVLAGNRVPRGADPMATVYAGHQFGVWAGRLGDGRALAIGAVPDRDGRPQVLQWKGSGPTTYARGGDGRAVLRSSIREFIASEAMAALGVPTTRALSLVGANHPVMRETREPAAVVLRVAPSFVRFGSFEYHAATGDLTRLRALADEIITHDYPHLIPPGQTAPYPPALYASWLGEVAERTAALIARWQALGFCHGVMNTDNMSILGLTLDYGPFGFLDRFDPEHRGNHSDTGGRYTWAMQPHIGAWNCAALAHALLPLLPDAEAIEQALACYERAYDAHWERLLRDKLGLTQSHPDDAALIDQVWPAMQASGADFTLFFRRLADLPSQSSEVPRALLDSAQDPAALQPWLAQYRQRLRLEHSHDVPRRLGMNQCNPIYVPRNHWLELAIRRTRAHDPDAAPATRDPGGIHELLTLLRHPYDERPERADYAQRPPAWAQTLCLSCSS